MEGMEGIDLFENEQNKSKHDDQEWILKKYRWQKTWDKSQIPWDSWCSSIFSTCVLDFLIYALDLWHATHYESTVGSEASKPWIQLFATHIYRFFFERISGGS